jgi:hypothetical protein
MPVDVHSKVWLRTLSVGLPADARQALMIVTAFMDDSGSEGKGPVFVLAGYIAPVDIWDDFIGAWQVGLDGPPRLEYFKMKEARRCKDAFKDFTPAQRDERVSTLADIISKQPVVTAYVLTLGWEDFRRAQSEHPEVTDCHPYDMLFHSTIYNATKPFVGGAPFFIRFVFDEQGRAGERALLTYKRGKALLPPEQAGMIVGSPGLEDDKKVLPLQAADLLAGQVRRYMADTGALEPPALMKDGKRLLDPTPSHPVLSRLLRPEVLWAKLSYRSIKIAFEAFGAFARSR